MPRQERREEFRKSRQEWREGRQLQSDSFPTSPASESRWKELKCKAKRCEQPHRTKSQQGRLGVSQPLHSVKASGKSSLCLTGASQGEGCTHHRTSNSQVGRGGNWETLVSCWLRMGSKDSEEKSSRACSGARSCEWGVRQGWHRG